MRRWRVISAVVLLTVSALCAATATANAGSAELNASERTVIKLINVERARYGLAPVLAAGSLCTAADRHSSEMLRLQYFSHLSYAGVSVATRVARAGYSKSGCSYWGSGEVLAWGGGALGTPQSVVRMWMHSPSHRAIILNRRWHDVGVGCAVGSFRGYANVALYTVEFGRRIR